MTGRSESANVARASFARSSATSAGTTRGGASITSATFFGPTAAVVTGRRWSIRETRGYGAALANVQPASTSVVTARPRAIRRASRRRRKTGRPFRGRAPTISGPAGRWALSRRIATEFWETARRSASVSWRDVRQSSPIPSAAIAFAFQLACPAGEPKAMIGLPRTSASRQVTPAVEWTTASAAAISSFMSCVKPRMRARGSPAKSFSSRSRICSFRPQMQTTFAPSSLSAARTARSSLPTPQPPPETMISGPSSGRPSERRASACGIGSRNFCCTKGRTTRALPVPATRSTGRTQDSCTTRLRSIHGCDHKRVHAEVADRCHGRDLQDPAAAQVADDARRGGMGRDDHVGVHAADEAEERLRAEQGQPRSRDRASGREAGEEEALEPVRPGQAAKLDAVDVPAHERDDAADVLECVVDDDLGRFGPQLGLERAGDGAVALALLGRENEHAAPRLRRRVRCRSEIDGLAHGSIFPQKPDGGNLWNFEPHPRRRIYMKRLLLVQAMLGALLLTTRPSSAGSNPGLRASGRTPRSGPG